MAVKNPLKILREIAKSETGFDLGDIAGGVASSVTKDVLKEGSKDFMRELLGLDKFAAETAKSAHHASGDLQEGQEVSFAKGHQKTERAPHVEAGNEYHREIVHTETRTMQIENRQNSQQLEQIRQELVKIRQASSELEATFKDITKETMTQTVKPGKYHVNFFEWMLATIQNARVRIESSASWISTISSKKEQRDYWSMSKSHGTSFSMSSERAVSQQVG